MAYLPKRRGLGQVAIDPYSVNLDASQLGNEQYAPLPGTFVGPCPSGTVATDSGCVPVTTGPTLQQAGYPAGATSGCPSGSTLNPSTGLCSSSGIMAWLATGNNALYTGLGLVGAVLFFAAVKR